MHDKNGKPLKKGDRVMVEAEILETSAGIEFCNVQIKITEKDQEHGPHNVTSNIWVNAKQTVLIEQ
jgi:hypothetical protein